MRALGVNQIDAQGPRRFQSVITVGFASREMGFRVTFAPQQSQPVHVRFGLSEHGERTGQCPLYPGKGDITGCHRDVPFVPKADLPAASAPR